MPPLLMAGFDRQHLPTRTLREAARGSDDPMAQQVSTGQLRPWDLFALRASAIPGAPEWADRTLDALVASATERFRDKLDCPDCEDVGFYGLVGEDPDHLTGLLRREGTGGYEQLVAGAWQPYEPVWDQKLEILDRELAGDLAEALTAGATALVRRYYWPKAFLPPETMLAAAPAKELAKPAADGAAPASDAKAQKVVDQVKAEDAVSAGPADGWTEYAVVDDLDPGAVINLIRLAPGPQLLDYHDGAWAEDPDLLSKLQGVNPPPLVELDQDQLTNVMQQIDTGAGDAAAAQPTTAAGLVAGDKAPLTVSPDPRAEKLRRYWSVGGKGGIKIRWGVKGDYTRCYRHLSKFMGVRAKGYCANMHKRNVGMWPGNKKNRGLSASAIGSTAFVSVARHTDPRPAGAVPHIFRKGEVVQLVSAHSRAALSPTDVDLPVGYLQVSRVDTPSVETGVVASTHGVPVVAGVVEFVRLVERPDQNTPHRPVGESAGEPDGRSAVSVAPDVASPRPAVLVASGGVVAVQLSQHRWSAGSPRVQKAPVVTLAHASAQPPRSAVTVIDATSHTAYCTHPKCGWVRHPKSLETALVASVSTGSWIGPDGSGEKGMTLKDGVYAEAGENATLLRTLTAGGFPVAPPDEWFTNPQLDGPTPLTVDDDGKVYGHIATFDIAHIGLPGRVHAPKSRSDYAYFKTGQLVTASGKKINVGQLTLAGGHAPLSADASAAVAHYDNTASACADLNIGEDRYGIWVAGALRPEVTPAQLRALRASAPSGDWRPINGNLEMVAVCQVNVPGFPTTRARVASGAITALVAAGARPLAARRLALLADAELATRLETLEAYVYGQGENEDLVENADGTIEGAEGGEELSDDPEAPVEPGEAPVELQEAPQETEEAPMAPVTAIERARALVAERRATQEARRAELRARVHGVAAAAAPSAPAAPATAADPDPDGDGDDDTTAEGDTDHDVFAAPVPGANPAIVHNQIANGQGMGNLNHGEMIKSLHGDYQGDANKFSKDLAKGKVKHPNPGRIKKAAAAQASPGNA